MFEATKSIIRQLVNQKLAEKTPQYQAALQRLAEMQDERAKEEHLSQFLSTRDLTRPEDVKDFLTEAATLFPERYGYALMNYTLAEKSAAQRQAAAQQKAQNRADFGRLIAELSKGGITPDEYNVIASAAATYGLSIPPGLKPPKSIERIKKETKARLQAKMSLGLISPRNKTTKTKVTASEIRQRMKDLKAELGRYVNPTTGEYNQPNNPDYRARVREIITELNQLNTKYRNMLGLEGKYAPFYVKSEPVPLSSVEGIPVAQKSKKPQEMSDEELYLTILKSLPK